MGQVTAEMMFLVDADEKEKAGLKSGNQDLFNSLTSAD